MECEINTLTTAESIVTIATVKPKRTGGKRIIPLYFIPISTSIALPRTYLHTYYVHVLL